MWNGWCEGNVRDRNQGGGSGTLEELRSSCLFLSLSGWSEEHQPADIIRPRLRAKTLLSLSRVVPSAPKQAAGRLEEEPELPSCPSQGVVRGHPSDQLQHSSGLNFRSWKVISPLANGWHRSPVLRSGVQWGGVGGPWGRADGWWMTGMLNRQRR